MNRRPLAQHFPLARLLLGLTLLVAALALPASDTAGETGLDAIRHTVRALIREQMKEHDVIGLSIALVDDQKILWAEGFGFADRARRLPARPDTLYTAGGLTQAFTAAAVMQLTEQGAIGLDEPIRRYLPEFAIRSRFPDARPITARLLLSHHAGLPAMHFRNMWHPRPMALDAFVASLRDEYAAYPPGQVFVPSFLGYDVLGRVIETQCRQPYAACLGERLLAPLGMPHSGFDYEHADRAHRATHYWDGKPMPSQTVRDVPAAGLTSSVTELARFVHMLLNDGRLDGRTILRPRSVAELLRAQNGEVALDLDNRVAMPWRLSGVRFPQARHVAWLNNESPFARGRILLVPEHRLGVILLTNTSGSTEAVRQVSERLMALVLEQRQPARAVEPARTAALSAEPAPPRRADVEGHYATTMGLISVGARGDHYRATMLGKTIDLHAQRDGLLAPEYRLLGLIPIPIPVLKEVRITPARVAGRTLAVAYYRDQAYRLGEKIAPHPLPASWRARLGEYQIVERDPLLELVDLRNATLAYSDGLLHFRYRVPGWMGLIANVPVRAVSDTELVVEGTGWLMGETVQVVKRDGREVLRYSGYEFRRIAQR